MMKTVFPESEELRRFLAREGWESGHAARQLGAGNRHRVFLLEHGGRRSVLKVHEPPAAGRRNAFDHEVLMHSFYAEQMGAAVPAMIAQDATCRAILFEHVRGVIVSGRENELRDIEAMARFIVESNRPEALHRAREASVPQASEGGASALEHWRCAAARLDELLALTAGDYVTAQMQECLRSEVIPALTSAKPADGSKVRQGLSPSDFGFHNIIRRENGSLCFLDFEHAGWDDPAKLVADFVLQPEAPLSDLAARRFVDLLESEAPFGDAMGRHARQILLTQKCKWTAIILNVFVRSTSDPMAKAARLTKASNYWRTDLPNF
jgi:hypothetical protein